MSAPIAARAASIFPASAIEPEPSSRSVNDTGASIDRSNMSLFTGCPSTKSFTSLLRMSVTGAPFSPNTVKGTITYPTASCSLYCCCDGCSSASAPKAMRSVSTQAPVRLMPPLTNNCCRVISPVSQRNEVGIVLMSALPAQEFIVAASRTIRIFVTDAGSRLIDGAASRLLIEEHARRLEDHILLVAKDAAAVAHFREALFRGLDVDAE